MKNLLIYWIESLIDIRHRHSTYTTEGITWIQHLPSWPKALCLEVHHIAVDLDDRFEYLMGLVWGYHWYAGPTRLSRFEQLFDRVFHWVLYHHRDKVNGYKFEL